MTVVDNIYATVRCCKDWKIVYCNRDRTLVYGWGSCGVCKKKPEFVSIDTDMWDT